MKKTIKQIMNEVLGLGFERSETYEEMKDIFIEAYNEAQTTIALTVRGAELHGRISILHMPIQNLLESPDSMDVVTYKGTPLVYSASGGRAYYLEIAGDCEVEVKDDTGTTMKRVISNVFSPVKGFCQGNVTITLSGQYAFAVRNVAVYGMVKSDREQDIPEYSRYVAYDMRELTRENGANGFYRFARFADERPVKQGGFKSDNNYRIVADYRKEEGCKILLSPHEEGQFEVWYLKYPRPIDALTPETTECELNYGASMLMPYLMSSRIWADDDPTKAAMYYNLYDDKKNQFSAKQPRDTKSPGYENTTGWW